MIPALVIAALHLALLVTFGLRGWLQPCELFNLLLLGANLTLAALVVAKKGDRFMTPAIMLLIASHALIGQHLAPDSLTSGAILMVNILTVYAGFNIFEHLPLRHGLVFVGSYAALFFIFILRMSHAEPLFLLALMGLAATARNFRLLAHFWALVAAFTVCQPYAWESAILFFLILAAAFSARSRIRSTAARSFLIAGLAFLAVLLLPILMLLLGQTPQSLLAVLGQPDVREALLLTAATATLSTLILAGFGIPLAYGLSRLDFRGKALVLSLIDVPIVVPQSVAGLALLMAFGRTQPIGGAIFEGCGIRFDGATAGIVLAQLFVALPFLVKPAMAAFDAVPPALELAARHLGANSLGVFRHLAVPLARRGLFLGAVLAWARAAGEFGAVYFMTASPAVAPIAVFNRFERVGLAETAPLVAAILLLSLVLFFLLQLASRRMPALHAEGGAP